MIQAKTIIEILGSPKEHVEETMKMVIEEVKKYMDTKLIEKEVYPAEQKGEFFSTFADITVEFKDITAMYSFCFNFMPSSIEIVQPESIELDGFEFSNSLNDLLATLHQNDRVLKESNAKLQILEKNMGRMLSNFIMFIASAPSAIDAISKKVGIPEDQLLPFLEKMKREGKLINEKELWKVKK